ncbi:cupin domain-containing protein [Luteimonas pelagia]
MKLSHLALAAALAIAVGDAPAGGHQPGEAGHDMQHADHAMVLPDDMEWMDVPALPKGARGAVLEGPLDKAGPFTLRLRLPADYVIPPHHHPAIEHVTVLSGTFRMATGDTYDASRLVDLPPGSVAIMQVGVNHFAATQGPVELQLHGVGPWGITYVNPADDPRKASATP